jgi:hypothetical protein
MIIPLVPLVPVTPAVAEVAVAVDQVAGFVISKDMMHPVVVNGQSICAVVRL